MQLPKGLTLPMLETKWASILNPLLGNPSNNASILKNVNLIAGTNTVNTLLGQKLQGWRIVRQRGPASIYDNQDINQSPQLTLLLVSDNPVVIDLEVF